MKGSLNHDVNVAARRSRQPRTFAFAAAALGLFVMASAGFAAWVVWRNTAGEPPVQPRAAAPLPPADAPTLARGEYLARTGHCLGCHTRRGGAPGAGGRAIATPFGAVTASNITPDADTGLGRWSAAEFRRALKHGRSRDGRLLAPAFPYPNFALVTDEDADALFAWLMSRPPVRQANLPHELRWPYGTQAALAVWRALNFDPQTFAPDPARSAAWNRGRYLVEGPAHCLACHAARNALGATERGGAFGASGAFTASGTFGGSFGFGDSDDRGGGTVGGAITAQQWLAPSLGDARAAGVGSWPIEDIVALLKTGTSPRGSAMGPMAEVVAGSTQHLSDADLAAMAEYLRSLDRRAATAGAPASTPAMVTASAAASEAPSTAASADPRTAAAFERGRLVYRDHCADCHGRAGEGTPGIAPLAGNRAVRMADPRNVVQAIRLGGFLPATAGNPRPFGMPPFAYLLPEDDIAAVATFVRGAWGNDAPAVQAMDLWRVR